MDGISDCFLAVWNLHIFTFCLRHANLDVINNSLRLLISRIIRSNDGQICQTTGNFSHLITAKPRTISATTKQADQSVWMILTQCSKKTFQSHCIMCIINHQSKFIRYFHHLNTAFYFCYLQSLQDIFLGNLKMTADCNSGKRVVNTEFTWDVDFNREIHKPLQLIGNSKIAFSANQSGILSAKVCFF